MPHPDRNTAQKIITEITEAERLEADAMQRREAVLADVEVGLSLRTPKANEILQAFKPPK